ncbi:diaminobutyrate decarboxylase [Candidatus Nitrosoglobus terrae]|uniref:Diaminobutyrate decarboxylase n=1 Tax=Candidatus Nitrosoglobus terrae TaxID=1630141 RepID=A0A1Q2SKK1_9GAMM|nr:pyridoxal-dependent decarboxylase [Candidatus Nitrosoglobus terrae]BAW79666.1 diaminobutyrate decarboxylase [Candidatus Nitrosoglobus terrae]
MEMTQKIAVKKGLQMAAFDPASLRKGVEIAVSKLEHYLSDSSIRGLSLRDPNDLLRLAKELFMAPLVQTSPVAIEENLAKIIDLYISTGIQVHSPGYMGRQFSGAPFLAGVIDLVSSIVSQPSSFYEAGQLPNVAEQIMADVLNRFIGYSPEKFAMITTSGGSLANLTAILAARNDKFPQFWRAGITGVGQQTRPVLAVSEDVHYSVLRAAGILGIGEQQVVRLPLDKKYRIHIDKVRPILDDAEQRGCKVFCIVASSGTTSVGAFDPLDELADIAQERDCWLHVDAAHGGGLLVSSLLRHKLKGIEKCDSFCWDAHKTMFMPAVCTLLFYKDKHKSFSAFQQTESQDASYVFEKQPSIYTQFDSAKQNFECTKRPLIMNLWTTWSLYGEKLFVEKIEYLCSLAREAFQILSEQKEFEIIHEPELNILCFRYCPAIIPKDLTLSEFQVAIRNRICEEGKFFISKVDIDGVAALRVVFMNHLIEIQHFSMLLDEIRNTAIALLSKHNGRG